MVTLKSSTNGYDIEVEFASNSVVPQIPTKAGSFGRAVGGSERLEQHLLGLQNVVSLFYDHQNRAADCDSR